MTRWRERQRRRRRRLFVLAVLATAGASTLWFRSQMTWFPWASAGRGTGAESSLALTSLRQASEGPTLAPVVTPSAATPSAATQPAVTPPAPEPTVEAPPAPRAQVPTTLPSFRRPTKPDPAKAEANLKAGMEALQKGDLLTARQLLSRAYEAGPAPADVQQVRKKLTELAGQTIFSKRQIPHDPLTAFVTVQSGDTLGKIASRHFVSEDLLLAINHISNRNVIRLGQRLKVVRGPWHAIVSKSRHIMDVYLQDKFVCSFPVALGMDGSTPTGLWKVVNQQSDPAWTDPRTGQRWHSLDPNNPIGEHWIGLQGVDGDAVGQVGYGIHGTIEPETIGKDVSMGCIRMLPDDVALVYKLLLPGHSYVFVTE